MLHQKFIKVRELKEKRDALKNELGYLQCKYATCPVNEEKLLYFLNDLIYDVRTLIDESTDYIDNVSFSDQSIEKLDSLLERYKSINSSYGIMNGVDMMRSIYW